MTKGQKWIAFGFCLLVSVLTIGICSTSSPLYPFNSWADANVYFGMGKAITAGKVLYRDVFDHKGPLLYFLHAGAYLVSHTTFFGVFLLEVAAFSSFLYSAFLIFRTLGLKRSAWVGLPLIAALALPSLCFSLGDSAEELCLPFLSWPVFFLLRYLRQQYPNPMDGKTLMLNGVLAGCVLWIKFTMLGLAFGWMAFIAILLACKGKWKEAVQSCGWFLLGMGIATLPWLVYFSVNGALKDWWEAYFYNNLFLYRTQSSFMERLTQIPFYVFLNYKENKVLFALLGAGIALFFLAPRKWASGLQKASVLTMTICLLFFLYIGGRLFPYYCFAFVALLPLALFVPLRLTDAALRRPPRALAAAMLAVITVCCGAVCYVRTPNRVRMGMPIESLHQWKMARYIADNAKQRPTTLLNYGFMDDGLFTMADIMPDCKYFFAPNIPSKEIQDAQAASVQTGECEFVLTGGVENTDLSLHYDLKLELPTTGDEDFEAYRLYQRRSE